MKSRSMILGGLFCYAIFNTRFRVVYFLNGIFRNVWHLFRSSRYSNISEQTLMNQSVFTQSSMSIPV